MPDMMVPMVPWQLAQQLMQQQGTSGVNQESQKTTDLLKKSKAKSAETNASARAKPAISPEIMSLFAADATNIPMTKPKTQPQVDQVYQQDLAKSMLNPMEPGQGLTWNDIQSNKLAQASIATANEISMRSGGEPIIAEAPPIEDPQVKEMASAMMGRAEDLMKKVSPDQMRTRTLEQALQEKLDQSIVKQKQNFAGDNMEWLILMGLGTALEMIGAQNRNIGAAIAGKTLAGIGGAQIGEWNKAYRQQRQGIQAELENVLRTGGPEKQDADRIRDMVSNIFAQGGIFKSDEEIKSFIESNGVKEGSPEYQGLFSYIQTLAGSAKGQAWRGMMDQPHQEFKTGMATTLQTAGSTADAIKPMLVGDVDQARLILGEKALMASGMDPRMANQITDAEKKQIAKEMVPTVDDPPLREDQVMTTIHEEFRPFVNTPKKNLLSKMFGVTAKEMGNAPRVPEGLSDLYPLAQVASQASNNAESLSNQEDLLRSEGKWEQTPKGWAYMVPARFKKWNASPPIIHKLSYQIFKNLEDADMDYVPLYRKRWEQQPSPEEFAKFEYNALRPMTFAEQAQALSPEFLALEREMRRAGMETK